jgi:transposase
MRDRDLYAQILGLTRPWSVVDVELDNSGEEVRVIVEHDRSQPLCCPECGNASPGYDTRRRQWRHLDTCQYRTILIAEVPRVECATHGKKQVRVPWAELNSSFTALYESLVIDWLKEASTSAVARRLNLSWDEVDGIMQRAVKRGLARRKADLPGAPARLGVDETSFAKRHEYVTVLTDLDTSEVLHVSDDRKAESLEAYYESLSEEELARIEVVCMDMWKPYIKATMKHVPGAAEKIAFDKFHVAKHLGDAVDQVRRVEHRELKREGDDRLTRTKYLWLSHPAKIEQKTWRERFVALRDSALRTARAWALKETAMGLWEYISRTWAAKAWKRWLGWALRSRLEPMRRVAKMIREHLHGIITAIVHRATNAGAESINAKIQRVKRMACGYRNRDRFRNAIYFHLAGLDLYPRTSTHTIS